MMMEGLFPARTRTKREQTLVGIAEHGSDTGNCMTESAVGCTSASGSRSVLMNPLSGTLCHVAQRPVAGPGGDRRLGHELRGDQGRPGGYPADAAGRPAFHAGGLSGGILHPAPAVAAALAVRLRRDDFPGPVRLSLLRDERRHARRAGLAGAAIPGVLHAVLRGAVPG